MITSTADDTTTGLRAWWAARSPAGRVLLAILAAVVAFNVGTALIGLVAGGATPGGPTSSSFATGADGYAAWAEVLAGHGHRVTKLKGALDDARVPCGATVIIADPDTLLPADTRAAGGVLACGGRVVVLGRATAAIASVGGGDLSVVPDGAPVARVLAPAPENQDVTRVTGAGAAHFDDPAFLLPILGAGPHDVLAGVTSVPAYGGRAPGRLVAIADAGVFANGNLGRADNAAFSLRVVGPGSDVYFAEGVHGFGESTGLAAIPWRWRWSFLGLVVAVLAAMWAAGRRLGPVEERSRGLAPERGEFVDGLAASVARAGDPSQVAAPLQDDVRRRVRERARLGSTAADADLVAAATAAGLDAGSVAGALKAPLDDRALVEVASAAARIRRGALPAPTTRSTAAPTATGGSEP